MADFKLTGQHLAGKICSYCDTELVKPGPSGPRHGKIRSKDHLVPKSLGLGYLKAIDATDMSAGVGNGVWCCAHCNALKDNLLPDQLRIAAEYHNQRAALLRQIADRAEAIIKERNLMP